VRLRLVNINDCNLVLRPDKHVPYSVSMSSKRPQKTNSPGTGFNPAASAPEHKQPPGKDAEDPDDLEEEFSLDQLSQAYAEVLRSRTGDNEAEDPAANVDTVDDTEEDELQDKPEINDNSASPISPESIVESCRQPQRRQTYQPKNCRCPA